MTPRPWRIGNHDTIVADSTVETDLPGSPYADRAGRDRDLFGGNVVARCVSRSNAEKIIEAMSVDVRREIELGVSDVRNEMRKMMRAEIGDLIEQHYEASTATIKNPQEFVRLLRSISIG